jgi:hypothetical protein
MAPLSPGRYRVQFTASAATRDKLLRAQELLRHQIPNGDVAAVIDRALEVLLKEIERKKFGAATRAGRSRASRRGSRRIPAAVRRAVWERDGETCTFVGSDGERCDARGFLEFDHRYPHAAGGPPTVDNVRMLCRTHNQYMAEMFFCPRVGQTIRESTAAYHVFRDRAVVSDVLPLVGGTRRRGPVNSVSIVASRSTLLLERMTTTSRP